MAVGHATVARRFFWAGLAFLALGGALALLMRVQWAYPKTFSPGSYAALFSSHGLIMIFFAITPLLIGAFGNLLVPAGIGARAMALPRCNGLSFWCLLAGQGLALASLLVPAIAPAAGWTMYPPLSTGLSTPGPGMTLMIAAIGCAGLGTILSAINLITTVVVARGKRWMELPLTVWGLFLTSVLNALFVPVLVAATVLLLFDRTAGTTFFAAQTGDPLLYQHLFWIFGHPEVYILVLPVWGIVADLVAKYAGRPPHWYRGTVYAFIAVTVLSGLVYGHHLFQAGVSPLFGTVFVVFTLAISAPSIVIAVNWLLTLRGGALRLTTPMLFSLGAILVFGLGGLTGMPLASVTSDLHFHDTLWVVGHFHLIMAAATLFGTFAAIYHYAPELFGITLQPRLALLHVAGTVPFAVVTFSGLLAAGYGGQLRRLADPNAYAFAASAKLNVFTSHAAFTLGAFQLLFFANLFWSLLRRKAPPATIETPAGHFDPARATRFAVMLTFAVGATLLLAFLLAAGAARTAGSTQPAPPPLFGALATLFIGASSLLAVLSRLRLAQLVGALFFGVQIATLVLHCNPTLTLLLGVHAILAAPALCLLPRAPIWKTYWYLMGGLWLCVTAFLYF